jgi:hypothetical protein
VVARFALRQSDRRFDPLVWLAILILATLRSPFLPGYGAFPSLWLVTLVAGVAWTRPSARGLAVAAWLVLALQLGQSRSIPVNAVVTFLHTAVALVLAFVVVPRVVAVPKAGVTPAASS